MKLNFATLDVFTTKRFAGNSLGVVFDADGIDGATMQVVAREFNHPETVFVLKPKAAGSTAGARIFTPGREMPFAGHPTVGTALVLTLRRGAGNDGFGELATAQYLVPEVHGGHLLLAGSLTDPSVRSSPHILL